MKRYSFWCKIGFHKYKQNKHITLNDIYPFFREKYENPKRKCIYCGKEQYWLPGYGGSEIGCWQNLKKEKK